MTEHIGTRVAYWRRRRGGMTQTALAGLAGVSQSYISQVEAGHKSVERRSTLVALAAALRVTVADLLGDPRDPTDPARDVVTAAVPDIRAVIIEVEEGDLRPPARAGAELDAAIEAVDVLRAEADYVTMAPLLAELLRDAAAVGGLALVRAGYETSVALRSLGFRDLALPAARIAVRAAREFDHAGWIGAASFAHTLALPIEATRTSVRIAEQAVTDLQHAAADVSARQMLGQMHLVASMASAVAGRFDTAADHLSAADAEAVTLGDPVDGLGFNRSSFGPTNLALWRMTVDVERGEFGRVIERARTFTPAPLKMVNRHQAYWMTVGRSLANSGKTDREALVAFTRAERVAPSTFALNPMIRDSVVTMVNRARYRSVSDDLRVMAGRLGIEVAA